MTKYHDFASPDGIAKEFIQIIEKCWHQDPNQRGTALQVVESLEHLWEFVHDESESAVTRDTVHQISKISLEDIDLTNVVLTSDNHLGFGAFGRGNYVFILINEGGSSIN